VVTRRVSVRIDELVLDGVEASPRVGAEVRAELVRLAAASPPAAPGRAARRTAVLGPGPLGPAVARAIWRGVGR
jgi:hypothetical protein